MATFEIINTRKIRTHVFTLIICLWVFYRKLKHSYFPYFASDDMKKYVTREKRVCFPRDHPDLIWRVLSFSMLCC